MARWGLIGTVVGLAVTLVVLSALTWVEARRSAAGVGRARAGGMMLMARRVVAHAAEPREAVRELMEDLGERGLRYAALVGRGGRVLVEVGEAATGPAEAVTLPGAAVQVAPRDGGGASGWQMGRMRGMRGAMGPPRMWTVGERYRVEAVVPRPRGAAWMGGRWGGEGGQAQRLPWGARLILEYEPVLARGMVRTAGRQLAVSVVVAVLLAGLGFVFWRLSLRAAVMREALARERRLAALGEMSAVLGHELRNPLASLKGHAQLVEERLEPGHRAAKSAARVVREAERLEALTGQILEFARTGSVERRVVDPGELARAVGAGRVVVRVEGAPAEWLLDEARMRQVLENLVDNAEKAVAEAGGVVGGPGVELFVRREGGGLAFVVRDRGVGLPAGEAAALFEPFRTHRVRGTGLGLAVARRIVEAHGGRIEARSWGEAGGEGGAEVRVWLPA